MGDWADQELYRQGLYDPRWDNQPKRGTTKRCRYCGRYGAHRCPLTPEPLADDPPFDSDVCDRAEDRHLNALIGEDPR